ncbi:MAG: hypothetical protein LJE68_01530 [Rhodobacter sp.]|nr:hypothetical protein [Rhodobacter sp.]
MRKTLSSPRIAAYLLMLAGALHVVAFVMGGFTYGRMGLAPVGLLFFVMAFGLLRGWRWLAYVTYLGVGIGASFAIKAALNPTEVANWWFYLIIAVDIAVVVVLFGFLWGHPGPARSEQDAA